MFQKILQWIREVFNKMINHSSVKSALHVDIAVSQPMAEALQLWSSMYENKAPWLSKEIRSLNLPSAIAGEIARAATIEMQVAVTGSPRADFLMRQLAPFLSGLREHVEKGAAKGGLVIKPYVSGKGIASDFVQADMLYPVAFNSSGRITACIFADQRQVGNDYYTRLEYHRMTPAGCEIRNLAFKSSTRDQLGNAVELGVIDDWAELLPEATITNVKQPLFAYFRMPGANNIDTTSPLGVGCYSRATDLIEDADRIYSNLLWEFKSGKRKMVVDRGAIGKDVDGKPILPTEEDRNLFMALDSMGENVIGEGGKLFEAWSPEFREASITSGLNTVLKRIEFECGLSYGVLSDPQAIEKTATELKVSQQRYYATITDTQKAIKTTLDDLLYAVDVWTTLANLVPRGTYAAVYDFDDSVVVDKDAQWSKDTQAIGLGVMSKVEFRMRNYKEDEATAKAKIAEVQAEQPEDMFGEGG
jgi:A118 family predicted phage portal protein